MDFRGGKVGIVGMELWAGTVQNATIRIEIEVYMSCKNSLCESKLGVYGNLKGLKANLPYSNLKIEKI